MLKIHGVFHDVEPNWSVEEAKGQATLVYVTEGKVSYKIERNVLRLRKGDLLFIPSNVSRAWDNDVKSTHKKYTVVFEKEETVLPFYHTADYFLFQPRKAGYYEQRLAFLYVQWFSQRSFCKELCQNILAELLILIAQEKAEWHASPVKEKTVRTIQAYILYNYRRNITIEELAESANVSPNYVTVLFKEVLGITPIQYLHQTRINTAGDLIHTTTMTIREISEYLGYCDQSYFNRMFKKWMGMAPSQMKDVKVGSKRQ